jgi:hypothetical protein
MKEKNMCTYHHHTTILLTQKETMNRRKNKYGHLPHCDNNTMTIDFTYSNATMNNREKNHGHLPMHDHCTLMVINYANSYTK